MAYGEEKKKDAVPFAGIQAFGNHADKVGNMAFIPKRGTAIEVDRDITSARIPFGEFLKKAIQSGIKITPQLNQQWRDEYGDSIEIKTAEEEVKKRLQTIDQRPKTEEEKQEPQLAITKFGA